MSWRKSFLDTIRKGLKIVGRGQEYGVIYDANESDQTVTREIARQAEILRKAGFEEPRAIEDQGYYELYNVSYGAGPNLDVLKKRYTELYSFLGVEVGKNLFIEKTGSGNYLLVYRRRGDKRSTLVVARRHAGLLRKKKILASITPETNNEVVFGESSLLDETGGTDEPDAKGKAAELVETAENTGATGTASQQVVIPPVAEKIGKGVENNPGSHGF